MLRAEEIVEGDSTSFDELLGRVSALTADADATARLLPDGEPVVAVTVGASLAGRGGIANRRTLRNSLHFSFFLRLPDMSGAAGAERSTGERRCSASRMPSGPGRARRSLPLKA